MSLDAAAYQQAAALFGETIVSLSDEEWERVTHPDDWTVITTVAWVVVGDAQLTSAASGEALQSVGEFDAAQQARSAFDEAVHVEAESDALLRVVSHRDGGRSVVSIWGSSPVSYTHLTLPTIYSV